MSDIALRAENLGKLYRIGAQRRGDATLRAALSEALRRPLRRLRSWEAPGQSDSIWALRDVSFEVKRGEVVGVVGHNGAGKSTLLKILSRITEPTTGYVDIWGRVGSLLEVGTGFHPELTGRENIHLNATILGMNRAEIDRNFDAIVAFSEIERFIDTPVKHYSSGMYVRLAFAVASHVQSDILLVDEVLAVGDAAFQDKCLDKVRELVREGRTVLFVSHSMPAIVRLCGRAILIESGTIVKDGPPPQVVQHYLREHRAQRDTAGRIVWPDGEGPSNSSFSIKAITVKDAANRIASELYISREMGIEIEFDVHRQTRAMFSLVLFDAEGTCVFSSLSNHEPALYHRSLSPGRYRTTCRLDGNLLNSGRYDVSITGCSDGWSDGFRADHAIAIDMMDDGILRGDFNGNFSGVVRPKLDWLTKPVMDAGADPLGAVLTAPDYAENAEN